jgi:hypothetical protein
MTKPKDHSSPPPPSKGPSTKQDGDPFNKGGRTDGGRRIEKGNPSVSESRPAPTNPGKKP